jgi:hypothetical protein
MGCNTLLVYPSLSYVSWQSRKTHHSIHLLYFLSWWKEIRLERQEMFVCENDLLKPVQNGKPNTLDTYLDRYLAE